MENENKPRLSAQHGAHRTRPPQLNVIVDHENTVELKVAIQQQHINVVCINIQLQHLKLLV